MATAVAAASGLAEWLPILGIGALSLMIHRRSKGPYTPMKEKTAEEKREETQREDMDVLGLSAPMFDALHSKLELAGGRIIPEMQMFPDERWKTNADIDPLEQLKQAHLALSRADRERTYYILHDAQKEEIRPSKRVPIAASLSPELYHPNDVTRVSHIRDWKVMPNYANDQQVKQALAQRDKGDRPDQALRRHYDVEFFTRAPGQSFRYE